MTSFHHQPTLWSPIPYPATGNLPIDNVSPFLKSGHFDRWSSVCFTCGPQGANIHVLIPKLMSFSRYMNILRGGLSSRHTSSSSLSPPPPSNYCMYVPPPHTHTHTPWNYLRITGVREFPFVPLPVLGLECTQLYPSKWGDISPHLKKSIHNKS